ncbi:MAG: hypothetical protein ACTHLN_03815, partial [Tepidisphaeraceae bacterium]
DRVLGAAGLESTVLGRGAGDGGVGICVAVIRGGIGEFLGRFWAVFCRFFGGPAVERERWEAAGVASALWQVERVGFALGMSENVKT